MSLAKSGSGMLLLTGANTYTGPTTVSGGTLALGQSGGIGATLSSTAAVTVNSGATFAVMPGATITGNNSMTSFTLARARPSAWWTGLPTR